MFKSTFVFVDVIQFHRKSVYLSIFNNRICKLRHISGLSVAMLGFRHPVIAGSIFRCSVGMLNFENVDIRVGNLLLAHL